MMIMVQVVAVCGTCGSCQSNTSEATTPHTCIRNPSSEIQSANQPKPDTPFPLVREGFRSLWPRGMDIRGLKPHLIVAYRLSLTTHVHVIVSSL